MMTKKILFLLTFLLTTIGGGNLALAATETFDLSIVTSGTSYDQTQNGVRLIIDQGSTISAFDSKSSRGYRLFHSGASITITAPEGYAVTELVLTSNNNGNSVNQMTGFTITDNSDWNPFSVDKAASYTWTNGSNTTNPITFTTKNSDNGDVYIASITVTYSKVPYSGTMPYTWQFHYGGGSNYWPNTTGEMLTANGNSKWSYSEPYYNYQLTPSSEQLVDGNDDVIDETKGLLFTASNAGDIFTGLQYEVGLKNSARVTIPAKAGQKIAVHAYWPKETMTLENATENSFTPSSEGVYTYNFTATADNVTLQVNSNTVFIYYIAVTKNDFAFSEHHTEYWDGWESTNTKSGTYKAGTTNFSVRANVPAGASVSKENFTVNSSSDAIDVSNWGFSKSNLATGEIWFNNLVVNKSGVAELTFTFKETDAYNSKSFTVLVNVVKGNIPYFQFTYNDKNKDERAISSISLNKTMKYETSEDRVPPFADVTFTSSNTEVATVNSSTGEITFDKPGISVITATFAGNDRYYGAETYFTLVVTGTENTGTITWTTTSNTPSTPPSPGDGQIVLTKDDKVTYSATSSLGGDVKYMSTDNDIVTVNASTGAIEAKHPGVAYIYAYQEGAEGQSWIYNDYKVQVNGGSISIGFEPESATITTGRILMPRLSIPSLEKADITSLTLTVESGGESYVSVSPNLLLDEFLEMQGYTIAKVHPRITALAPTSKPVKVTAHFVSPYYNNGAELTADFYVTVTNNTGNFSWATSKTEFTIVEGEYMMMPSITGNANGNIDGLSKGSVCEARHGYVYSIMGSSRTITWNNANYYYGEGFPDYTLTPAAVGGGEAYIYWCTGEDSNHPSLMIYGESAGDMILRATDSQTGYSPDPITIHIVDKADNVTDVNDAFWADKKFPFTWDFTNIAPADIVDDDVHWRKYGFNNTANPYAKEAETGEHILGMPASFNYDYSDEDYNGVGYEQGHYQMLKKYITNGEGDNCKIMPAFYGIRLDLGNNASGSYWSKRDKVTLYDTDSSEPRLYIEGGEHRLYLPAMPASKRPSATYRIYIKTRGHNANSTIALLYSGENDDNFVWSGNKLNCPTVAGGSTIYFDIPADNAGKKVGLAFENNVDVYWIAFSTEARTLMRPDNTTYAAATYSYNADLDLSKSAEVNEGVKAYYASNYAFNEKAEATGTDGYAVVMTEINTPVPANTGLILKKNTTDASTPCYMIANGQNVESYTAPDPFESGTIKNYLKPTSTNGETVGSNVTIGSTTYTNFAMAYAYKMYHDPMEAGSAYTDYLFDRDWSFYKIMGNVNISKQKSYLQIPGNLYVDRDGNIVEGAASRRAADDNRPSTKPMLDIIYEDVSSGDSGVTGITSVSDRLIDNDAWYTLQGIRVDAPAKGGIYIHNGRKVVIK